MGKNASFRKQRKLDRIASDTESFSAERPDADSGNMPAPLSWGTMALHVTLLTVLTFVLSIFPIESEDIFSNIVTGEYLWTRWEIPELDPFSYTGPHKWLLNRPLPSVLFYLVHSIGGLPAIQVFCAGILALVYALLYAGWSMRTRRPALTFGVAALTILASCYWFQARIYVFAYLYTALSLLIVTSSRPRALLWAVPLQVLWINSHPSAILGVFFVGIWCMRDFHRNRGVTWFSGGVLVAVILSNAASPMGFKSFGKFAEEIFAAHPSRTNILEWLSPFNEQVSSQHLAWWFYGACVVMALATAYSVLHFRAVRSSSILLPISCALFFLSVGCARHIPLFYVAFASLLICSLECALKEGHFVALARHRGTSLALYALVPFVVYKVAFKGYSNGAAHRSLAFGIESRKFPEKAIQILKQARVGGNIFSDYDTGSYFLYRMYPDYKAYIDGARLDEVYGESGFAHYMQIGNDLDALKADIAKYDIRAFIIPLPPSASEIVVPHRYLSSDPGWRLAYFDDVNMLFVRRDEAQDKNIPTYSFLSPFATLSELIKSNPDAAFGLERDFRQGEAVNPDSIVFLILKSKFLKLQKRDDQAKEVAEKIVRLCRAPGASPACGFASNGK